MSSPALISTLPAEAKLVDPVVRHGASKGAPKKHGAGGRFTWGVAGSELGAPAVCGANDPLYDSEGDDDDHSAGRRLALKARSADVKDHYKQTVRSALTEFFVSADVAEVGHVLHGELGHEHRWMYEFVAQGVIMALEKHDHQRELLSRLLVGLALPSPQIAQGFTLVLDRLSDLVLDTPDAVEVVGKFIARAISDESIPPSFLALVERELAAGDGSISRLQHECIESARRLVNAPKHSGTHLQNIWHEHTHSSLKHLKKAMRDIVDEYLLSLDFKEAEKSLRELDQMPFLFHFVRVTGYVAVSAEADEAKLNEVQKRLASLLQLLLKEGLLSAHDISTGIRICVAAEQDIELDVGPKAGEYLKSFIELLKANGALDESFMGDGAVISSSSRDAAAK